MKHSVDLNKTLWVLRIKDIVETACTLDDDWDDDLRQKEHGFVQLFAIHLTVSDEPVMTSRPS